jgi:hypothetical protein
MTQAKACGYLPRATPVAAATRPIGRTRPRGRATAEALHPMTQAEACGYLPSDTPVIPAAHPTRRASPRAGTMREAGSLLWQVGVWGCQPESQLRQSGHSTFTVHVAAAFRLRPSPARDAVRRWMRFTQLESCDRGNARCVGPCGYLPRVTPAMRANHP